MIRIIGLFLVGLVIGVNCLGQGENLGIIPKPVYMEVLDTDPFNIERGTRITINSLDIKETASFLNKRIKDLTGYSLSLYTNIKEHEENNNIKLKINEIWDDQIGEEGYKLNIKSSGIGIDANSLNGIFYGIQTLTQLLPSRLDKPASQSPALTVPSIKITDFPRFKWRGLMLDVSRHFFDKEFILKYLDEMAKYKFNIFHWHLTDDQGWRIEIKGLPKLTQIGSWRVPRVGPWMKRTGPMIGEKKTYGGFYTQEEVREIVEYAQKRQITIVPEIDVPGHSLALIASYPSVSCTKEQYQIWSSYQPGVMNSVLCVSTPRTWSILDTIFTQIAELFPSGYIHVGGDEVDKSFWANHEQDSIFMKEKGIKSVNDLQGYFEKRVENMLKAKGKKMIGWDEILEGEVSSDATVMSWRGEDGAIEAANRGNNVIMTPYKFAYLDFYQGEPLVEPAARTSLRLSKCYSFEPVPDGVNKDLILGGQGNLWSEDVPNFRHAEYMTWPRALALSEVFWTPAANKNWADFMKRVLTQFGFLEAADVKYSESVFDPIIKGEKDSVGRIEIYLESEIPDADIYYTFDSTDPDLYSNKYNGGALSVPRDAYEIRVRTYYLNKPLGRQINCPINKSYEYREGALMH